MPFFVDKTSNEAIYRVGADNTPDQFRSPQYAGNTLEVANKRYYAEAVTESNPETAEDGTPMQIGNFCMWCNMGNRYEKREASREFFLDTYVEVNALPDQPEGPYSIIP